MRATFLLLALLTLTLSTSLARAADKKHWPLHPADAVATGLGVNIHFTDPHPGELEMLAAAGFKWVRMDLSWVHTEPRPGVYDFSAYDRLLASLDRHGLRALLILDYANPHYDDNQSPRTDAGRAAFARWAVAAAKRFAGRGVMWELYNEPNIGFWRPQPNTADYIQLAHAVGRAFKQEVPNEIFVGPATSGIPLPFLEECFRAGLLEYFDAVTVHPYRQHDPESAAAEIRKLRALIERFAPECKPIPVLSGEWGYSSAWKSLNESRQAQFLPRQLLSNVAAGLPLSIWYDWRDDGPDPHEPEHHFGTVRHAHRKGQTPPFEPKPAYLAMQRLTRELSGWRFDKRLPTGSPEDHVLLFTQDNRLKLAAWTTSPDPRSVTVAGVPLKLTDTVTYTDIASPPDLLRLAAAWNPLPRECFVRGSKPATVYLILRNPLSRPITVRWSDQSATLQTAQGLVHPLTLPSTRGLEPVTHPVTLQIDSLGSLTQETAVVCLNPLVPTLLPPLGNTTLVQIQNPSGEPFTGKVTVGTAEAPLTLAEGQREALVTLPATAGTAASLFDSSGLVATGPRQRFHLVPLSASQLKPIPDGDAKVKSDHAVSDIPSPAPDLPGPAAAAEVRYQFDAGWKFLRLDLPNPQPLPGQPTALGLWVYSDASGNHLRCRFTDATHQTFQPEGTPLTWRGWRYVTFPLDRLHTASWGGRADGRIHYPIRISTLALIDSALRQPTQGTLRLSTPTLLYTDAPTHPTIAPAAAQ